MKATYPKEEIQFLEIEKESSFEIEQTEENVNEKAKHERKLTPREQQMNKQIFSSNYEKYEWLMANGCTNSDDRNWLNNLYKYINLNRAIK